MSLSRDEGEYVKWHARTKGTQKFMSCNSRTGTTWFLKSVSIIER